MQSTRPSARWLEKSAPHLVALRGRPAEDVHLRPPPSVSVLTVSMQTKILVSYLILGAVLLYAIPVIREKVQSAWAAGGLVIALTCAVGYVLTWSIARVNRIVRLKASAVEISRGDLSRSVVSEEQKNLHDEIDDLTHSIRTMQENL